MGLIRQSLGLLFPRGRPWQMSGDLGKLLDGLAVTLERPKTVLRNALAEALPGTATLMLPEWHVALGQPYDPSLPIATQRMNLAAILTTIGGVDIESLNEQIQKELPNCYVAEPTAQEQIPHCYYVNNNLPGLTDYEYERLWTILSHYAPLHLQPIEVFDIIFDTGDSLGFDTGDTMIALLALDF
jgi:hypothetical protein